MSDLDKVVLVDENDKPVGLMDKLAAHEQGVLHRAFSVFLFNGKGELLLQKRASEKYHSPGLWTNTCCSHQLEGEDSHTAALRRLEEEMGISCDVNEVFTFIYKADVKNGLIEHEFDHVFIGTYDNEPLPNRSEVEDWKYLSIEKIEAEMESDPNSYTEWFKIALPMLKKHLK